MPNEPLITPDSPIEARAQDLLGRGGFADLLADALTDLVRGPGLVVGLNGPWGSGKSSVKNLVLERIRLSGAAIEVVEFNPWEYESSGQLTREFFTELAAAISESAPNEDERKARRAKLWKYGSRVAKVGAMGLSAFLPIVGVAVDKATDKLLEEVGKVMEEASGGLSDSAQNESLSKLKKELSDELKKLEKPVLVVIDDIDRLDETEVKLLFKLVKANADFSNVSYLLLFARDRVARALNGVVEDGDKFLEKIVTVSFDVPALTSEDTLRVFEGEVVELVSLPHVASTLDKARWERAKDVCIRPYLDTIRTVRRYTNMLRFLTRVYSEGEALRVNFVDLAVLEVLRVFEPEVYKQLPHLAPSLTEGGLMYLQLAGIGDVDRMKMFMGVIDAARESGRRPLVRACLSLLFPQVDWTSGDWADHTYSDGELQRMRVNRAPFFGRYFGFDVEAGLLSETVIESLISATAHRTSFRECLERLTPQQHLHAMMILSARQEVIPEANIAEVFAALYQMAESSTGTPDMAEGVSPNAVDGQLLVKLLQRDSSDDRIRSLVRGIAEDVDSLVLPVALIVAENTEKISTSQTASPFMSAAVFGELRDWAVASLRDKAQSRELLKYDSLYNLIHYWGWLSSPEDVRQWIEALAGSPGDVKRFLALVVAPKLIGDRELDIAIRIRPLNYVEDPTALEADIEELAKDEQDATMRRSITYCIERIRARKRANERAVDGAEASDAAPAEAEAATDLKDNL